MDILQVWLVLYNVWSSYNLLQVYFEVSIAVFVHASFQTKTAGSKCLLVLCKFCPTELYEDSLLLVL